MTGKIIKEYFYKPTDTHIILYDNDLVVVRFGIATTNLVENTLESQWVDASFTDMVNTNPTGKFAVMIDLSTVGSGEYNSDESNAIYKKIVRDPHVKEVGIYGLSIGWDLLIGIFRFYAKIPLRTFVTEEQTLEWLLNDPN